MNVLPGLFVVFLSIIDEPVFCQDFFDVQREMIFPRKMDCPDIP